MAWMRFRKREMPEGLWTKCDVCKEMLFQKELLEAQWKKTTMSKLPESTDLLATGQRIG